jgi:hypothetical protein
MDWTMLETLAAWAAVALVAIGMVAGFCLWFAKLYAKVCNIESGVKTMQHGDGVVCVRHGEQIRVIEKTIKDHGTRITTLEQQRGIRQRPA